MDDTRAGTRVRPLDLNYSFCVSLESPSTWTFFWSILGNVHTPHRDLCCSRCSVRLSSTERMGPRSCPQSVYTRQFLPKGHFTVEASKSFRLLSFVGSVPLSWTATDVSPDPETTFVPCPDHSLRPPPRLVLLLFTPAYLPDEQGDTVRHPLSRFLPGSGSGTLSGFGGCWDGRRDVTVDVSCPRVAGSGRRRVTPTSDGFGSDLVDEDSTTILFL